MSKSAEKFTKGPWRVEAEHTNALDIVAQRNSTVQLATIMRPDQNALQPWDKEHANARLMAAAPELYEALEEAVAYLNAIKGPNLGGEGATARDVRIKAESILAKARGESS